MIENNSVYRHWTNLTRTCYKQKMNCTDCQNRIICSIEPWNLNPYGIKNIKYAVIRTLANIGEPK